MSWEAWFTLAVVAITITLLVREVAAPSGLVFGAVIVLLVAGVIEGGEALAGFSNPAPVTVAALYVVAAGIERTGVLNRLVDVVIGSSRGQRATLGRLLLPAAGASAFLNNTPVVAMLSPAVSRWAERAGRAVSTLLMPLSFAAILGGMITVIGTSTNIVVSGLLEDSGLEPFDFFEVAKLGLPVAVAGLAAIVLLAPIALPDRRPARSDIEDFREFVVEMRVVPGGPVDGMTVGEAGLRHLAGVFLVQVERDGRVVGAIGPEFALEGGDTLRFVGNALEVADLQERSGIEPAAGRTNGIPSGRMAFYEAIVGVGSTLLGRSLRDVGFRQRYQAAVVAIHRADQRLPGKLGDTRLRVGDTLLVLGTEEFWEQWHRSADFILVARLDQAEPARSSKAALASIIGLMTIGLAAFGVLSILEASLLGGIATVITGVLTVEEARSAVDLDVVILIAASFGLGAALTSTGLASRLADGLVAGLDGLGGPVVLIGIALTTLALTELITNNAAAVLIFPIALAVAADIGADPRAFAVTVALAASASFLTPIGYQTNTMVWGPGGYRFGDYARLGLPITVATIVSVAVVAPMWWAV
jgi:di/tricarboxylate transporter